MADNHLMNSTSVEAADAPGLNFAQFQAGHVSTNMNLNPNPELGHSSSNSAIFNTHTISDDQSTAWKVQERNLLALRESRSPSKDTPVHSNHSSLDYNMQFMLLEQQNKRRQVQRQQTRGTADTAAISPSTTRHLAQRPQDNKRPMQQDNQEHPAGNIDMQQNKKHRERDLSHTDSGLLRSTVIDDLQKAINSGDTSQLDIHLLQECISTLRARSTRAEVTPSRFQILSRFIREEVTESGTKHQDLPTYLDEPQWTFGQKDQRRLQCHLPITNFDLFLEQNKDISFLVYRDYDPSDRDSTQSSAPLAEKVVEVVGQLKPEPLDELIRPVAPALVEAIQMMLSSKERYRTLLHEFRNTWCLKAPYLFMYHSRNDLDLLRENMTPSAWQQFSLFLNYVLENYGDKYAMADALFAQKKVLPEFVSFLFEPGDILVERSKGHYQGIVAKNWPRHIQTKFAKDVSKNALRTVEPWRRECHARDELVAQVWQVDSWTWKFDGQFNRTHQMHQFEIEVDKSSENNVGSEWRMNMQQMTPDKVSLAAQTITDLQVFPLKYAAPELVQTLFKRDVTFWRCRNRQLVSYIDDDKDQDRYIIDLKTYQSLHGPRLPNYNPNPIGTGEGLPAHLLANEEPPITHFSMLMPAEITGYNLRSKKWLKLEVDRIQEVEWNVEAFENLVIEPKAGDLIKALVSNHIAAEKSTDIIAGKGNGLILLLHGGPGTGKTLTAESVAEVVKKPLYRVTCGDVGTKAEDVEKYLDSVFHLGKIWDCVVLIDEADIFLEQRGLQDLNRGALVSCFLRALEYYNGILILTTNRVGTFDEAFKSRIQLALHYPPLGQTQRMRIWDNFISRLDSFGDNSVDVVGLRRRVQDLSQETMNGRQIRNAITTARQYAKWKGAVMTYEHLKDVIEVAGRFDKYIDELHGGVTNLDRITVGEGSDWTGWKGAMETST